MKKLFGKTPEELYSTRRIENLTDGVFAIAMTLLVLDLNVPRLAMNTTDRGLWQALAVMSPNFFSFALSFAILGIMWSVHMRQFEYIERVDKRATALNTLRLFIVVLIPFTTSLNSEYSRLLIGQLFYPLNLFLLALITYLQGLYVSHHHSFYRTYNLSHIRTGQARSLVFVLVTALVCVLTPFFGSLAFFAFLLITILNPVIGRIYK